MQVMDQFYVFLWRDSRENNCNSVVIDGKVPLLIDPGHERLFPDLAVRMREEGFDPHTIEVVIGTHAHPDHFEGTRVFEASSVKIGLSAEEEKYIHEVGSSLYLHHAMNMPEHPVDFNLREGNLTISKHEFEVLLTPGHTPGSICIYWPRHKILIAGDVIFAQGVGRSDMPGGDGKKLKESIERLSKLRVELLIPGHGPAVQGADKVRANFEFVKKHYFGML